MIADVSYLLMREVQPDRDISWIVSPTSFLEGQLTYEFAPELRKLQISIVQCRRDIRAEKRFVKLLGKFSMRLKGRFLDILATTDYILIDFSEMVVAVIGGVLVPVFYLSVLRDLSIIVKKNLDLRERWRLWHRRAVEKRATRFSDFNLDPEIRRVILGLHWISKRLESRPLVRIFYSEFLPRDAMEFLRLLGQSSSNVDIEIYGSPLRYSAHEKYRPETNHEFLSKWRLLFQDSKVLMKECVLVAEESHLSSQVLVPEVLASRCDALNSVRSGPIWEDVQSRFAGSWGALLLQTESAEFQRALITGIGEIREVRDGGPSSLRFDYWWRFLGELERTTIQAIAVSGGTLSNIQLEQLLLRLKIHNPAGSLKKIEESSGFIIQHSNFVRCANSFLLGQILNSCGTAPRLVKLLKETNWISKDFDRATEYLHRKKLLESLNPKELHLVKDFANRLEP